MYPAWTTKRKYGAALKADALRQAPADDLVGIRMNYKMKNICGVNEVTVTMTAAVVKTK